MTPAERLRAAAQLARETAEAATSGPWVAVDRGRGPWCVGPCSDPLHRDGACYGVSVRSESPDAVGWQLSGSTGHDDVRGRADSTHIALWSPPVALAVAAWLEGCAADLDALMQYTPPDEALAVADALLQTQPVKP